MACLRCKRQPRHFLKRLLAMLFGYALRVSAGIRSLKVSPYRFQVIVPYAFFTIDALQFLSGAALGAFQEIDHREGFLSSPDIVAPGLAGNPLLAPDAEDIIPDLEGQT